MLPFSDVFSGAGLWIISQKCNKVKGHVALCVTGQYSVFPLVQPSASSGNLSSKAAVGNVASD